MLCRSGAIAPRFRVRSSLILEGWEGVGGTLELMPPLIRSEEKNRIEAVNHIDGAEKNKTNLEVSSGERCHY